MKKDDFVLPEAWYVVVTKENSQALASWRLGENADVRSFNGKIIGLSKNTHGEDISFSKEHNPVGAIKGDNYDFGQEITFDQFKKYVLFEEPEDLTYLIDFFKKLNIK